MSGGSWDYFYSTANEVASRLMADPNLKRRAMGTILGKIAKAMRAVEWNDSSDGDDEEDRLLDEVLTCQVVTEMAQEIAEEVDKTSRDLRSFLESRADGSAR